MICKWLMVFPGLRFVRVCERGSWPIKVFSNLFCYTPPKFPCKFYKDNEKYRIWSSQFIRWKIHGLWIVDNKTKSTQHTGFELIIVIDAAVGVLKTNNLFSHARRAWWGWGGGEFVTMVGLGAYYFKCERSMVQTGQPHEDKQKSMLHIHFGQAWKS